jgi:hypothetical protein
MQAIRRSVLAVITVLAAAVPASAQTAAAADTGPSLLWVWVWILVAGVFLMIVGTSVGIGGKHD